MKVSVRAKSKRRRTERLADGTLLDVFGKLYVVTYSCGKQARYYHVVIHGVKFLGNKFPASTRAGNLFDNRLVLLL